MRVFGKTVVVAGAGDNMGRAVPRLLAREGAKLLLVSRNAEALRETERLCARSGGRVVSILGELTDRGTVARMVAEAEELGGADALVYLAGGGFQPEKGLDDLDEATWYAVTEVSQRGPFLVTRALLPQLRAKRGSITFVTASPPTCQMGSPAYAAAKAGVTGFARNLARRLFPEHVRVNVVAPGLIWYRHDDLAPLVGEGLDRYGAAVDVAYAVLYLVSDEASWVTGAVLPVDGGDGVLGIPPERRQEPNP